MKTLVIADVKDKASLEKLKSVQCEAYLLVGANVKAEDVPAGLGVQTIEYGTFKLSQFDEKIVILSENHEFNDEVTNLLKNFKVRTGSYRPFIWRKEVCTGDTLDNVNLIIKSAKKQDVARYILRVDVFDENMRYLNAKKMKFYINRAFFRVGFPARKKKIFLSDKFKYKNYSYGIDYCIGQLTEKPTISTEELVEKFNEHLVPFGIRAERLEIYSMATKAADISEFFMSEIQTDFDISKVKSAIEEFLASDSCIVKVKQQGMMRDSWVTVDVDARPHVKDIWAEQLKGVTIIRMISEAPVSFYQLLPAILKTSQKNIMRFPVRRLEYFKLEDEGALDFFDETCEISGNTIEKNPFDEQISDRFCARYLPFDSALATFGGEFTEEDEKADEEAEAINAPAGQSLSPEHDIVDIEGEGDEFESDESDQDND